MKTITLVGLASAALLAAAATTTSAVAADLGNMRGGSVKDGYAEPMRQAPAPAGRCYVRGDVGYSWSRDPHATWSVSDLDVTTDGAGNVLSTTSTYKGDTVTNLNIGNTAFGGVGIGCGSGSRGIRGEVALNFYGKKKYDGEPLPFIYTEDTISDPPVEDPLHTSISSRTMMFNAYYDMGQFGRFTPYVGAGVGVARNTTSGTYFTGNTALTNVIQGDTRYSLAWSLMAGVGMQVSDRAILDIGYRFTDLGKARSGTLDNLGFTNPAVKFDDLQNHEIRIGLRYHFGGSHEAVPMK